MAFQSVEAGYTEPHRAGRENIFTERRRGFELRNTATGERLWQLRLKGPFSASPVVAGNYVYCVSEKGVVQVVDPSKPEGEIIGELDLGETILSTPSIANGAIYFRSDARLWKIGNASATSPVSL